MIVSGPSDGWARPRFRLRDLVGRERLVALAMLALVLAPFVVALVRAARDGWVPSGDEANIATRALDVFSRHPPLTGLPSTSDLYGRNIATNHPGPIEFYVIAVPLRVLGMSAGPLFTAAAINAGCVVLVLWVFFRRLGLNAMLWAGVLALCVIRSGGTAVPPERITQSASTPAHNIALSPSRRKKTQSTRSTHPALIAAAVRSGPADMPSTRSGTAIR